MFSFTSKPYEALSGEEQDEVGEKSLPKLRRETHLKRLTLINVVILALSTGCLFTAYRTTHTRNRCTPNSSNILGIQLPTEEIQVEGDFGDDDNYRSSIYRQPPGPEVDQAWARIANSEMIVIKTEEVIAIGKDPTLTVRAPEEWGFGPDAHLGVLDVFHQIHCLNALRRGVYYEHYFAPSMGDIKTDVFFNHMGHCMSILLQNIMCSASLDVITHSEYPRHLKATSYFELATGANVVEDWVKGHRLPVPDFSIQHQCRDIEAVVEWQAENSIDYEVWSKMKAPENARQLEPSEALLEAFKLIASHKHDANFTVPF
ncbi:hypothetical protein G7054_g8011 [Neopestalotiopsis clavispora]|nr:hypothetical protein G7054_g8011 [Neopestalotiopsis clavispora]